MMMITNLPFPVVDEVTASIALDWFVERGIEEYGQDWVSKSLSSPFPKGMVTGTYTKTRIYTRVGIWTRHWTVTVIAARAGRTKTRTRIRAFIRDDDSTTTFCSN